MLKSMGITILPRIFIENSEDKNKIHKGDMKLLGADERIINREIKKYYNALHNKIIEEVCRSKAAHK